MQINSADYVIKVFLIDANDLLDFWLFVHIKSEALALSRSGEGRRREAQRFLGAKRKL